MSDDRIDHGERHLSADDIEEIQRRWDQRVTIASLAEEYGVSEPFVRFIISQPRRKRLT